MGEPTTPTEKTWRKLFEQSFIVICLCVCFYYLFLEYKDIFATLTKKNARDETLLIERVRNLNLKNEKLYERLINCKDGTKD